MGWRGDWVLVYGGHGGCFGLGVGLLGLMTLASQGIPLLVLGVCLVAGLRISFSFSLCIGVLSLCWAACLGSQMETWATIILLLDSNGELNNQM